MTVVLVESPESRPQQVSVDDASYTLLYTATGEQDDAIVRAYATANTPTYVDTADGRLYRRSLQLQPDGFKIYRVQVEYAPAEGGGPTLDILSFPFTFDTTGGTTNIKCAREHIASYPSATTTPNHAGAIGVEQDGTVTGVDIVVPALKFSIPYKYAPGIVTIAWAKNLSSITGTTNLYRFLAFDPGELLFAGASATGASDKQVEVTFNFVASGNVTNLARGGITGITKKGHEYAWEEVGDNVDVNGNGITKAKAVHVERVYNAVDFASYFNWNVFTG